jgi:LuxR family maltose regulon positive regulatory protein
VGYHQIKLLLRNGKRSQALHVASRLEIALDDTMPELPDTWNREVFQKQMIQARLWLVGGQQETSIFVVKRLYELAEQIGLGYRVIESLILLSHAYFSSGDKLNAVETMKCALEQAAVNDAVRLFLDEGQEILPIVELVQSAISGQGSLAENICQTIMADFSDGLLSKQSRSQTLDNAHGLIDPLSQRELEVLMLMARGQSNAHIANQLNISENTVKWHGGNIFGKLGVTNRTEAVITAQEMDMLATL